MKVHYFQRYHSKENVDTANAMLLLSRLYQYSTDKFFHFLRLLLGDYELEMETNLQVRNISGKSIPDAIIRQPGFKLVIETKEYDWFYADQLIRHMESFGNEENNFLITLAPEEMPESKKNQIDAKIDKYNEQHHTNIHHINTTFEKMSSHIKEVINDRDIEMQEVLDDYLDYCYGAKLIGAQDAKAVMRMRTAGTTWEFNIKYGVYYDVASNGYSPHAYLGLYKNKAIRYIGKIAGSVVAYLDNEKMIINSPKGEIDESHIRSVIQAAWEDANKYGWGNIKYIPHRFFFVEQFYETDFAKVSKGAARNSRFFNLKEILDIKKLPNDVGIIAKELSKKTWE